MFEQKHTIATLTLRLSILLWNGKNKIKRKNSIRFNECDGSDCFANALTCVVVWLYNTKVVLLTKI